MALQAPERAANDLVAIVSEYMTFNQAAQCMARVSERLNTAVVESRRLGADPEHVRSTIMNLLHAKLYDAAIEHEKLIAALQAK